MGRDSVPSSLPWKAASAVGTQPDLTVADELELRSGRYSKAPASHFTSQNIFVSFKLKES